MCQRLVGDLQVFSDLCPCDEGLVHHFLDCFFSNHFAEVVQFLAGKDEFLFRILIALDVVVVLLFHQGQK